MKNFILPLISALILTGFCSCSLFERDDPPAGNQYSYLKNDGLFVINEGNFMAGNGSVSFYSFENDSIYNDLFAEINGRPLGDVPNSIAVYGDKAYIVVNNSGKIEVAERSTLKSTATIRNLDSPRNFLAVGQNKAYVTSLWSKKITIIDLTDNTVSGYIDIRRSSEAIVIQDDKVFVSCWASGQEILVIDPATDMLVDSIPVGNEPESMVIDNNKRLWVLCSGGYSGLNFPKLVSVNTVTNQVEKVLVFPLKTISPASLCINSAGDTLYYIERGVRRMSISDNALPEEYFVPSSGRMFYKLFTDTRNGGLFVTNAIDFQQKGYLLRLNSRGLLRDSVRAGIIPGSMCNNVILN